MAIDHGLAAASVSAIILTLFLPLTASSEPAFSPSSSVRACRQRVLGMHSLCPRVMFSVVGVLSRLVEGFFLLRGGFGHHDTLRGHGAVVE